MDIAALQTRMREAFRIEAADLLTELDSSLLELETRPQDADLLNRVFRAIHTIKGSGATAGFNEMAAFTHHIEELFDEARMGHLTITPAMVDLALQAKDLIGQLMDPSQYGDLEPACTRVVQAVLQFLPKRAAQAAQAAKAQARPVSNKQRHKIFFRPHPQVFFSGTDPVNMVDELRALGKASVTTHLRPFPELENLNPEECYLAWDIELISEEPIAKIQMVFMFVEDESEIRIESEALVEEAPARAALPRTAFMEIAHQSLIAVESFLEIIDGSTEAETACCKNYIRILKSLQAATRQAQQDQLLGFIGEQLEILQPALANTAPLPAESKAKLSTLHLALKSALQVQTAVEPATAAPTSEVTAELTQANTSSTPPAEEGKKESFQAATTIRVDQEKLDRLMRSAGELLVARNAFPVLAKRLVQEHGLSAMGKEIKDAGAHISHIAEDLQAAVLSIRMMPIRMVFQRFARMVRDICRTQGKEVELILEGEDTELDKTVIEKIADPLVHLVRNAVDHGIEAPEARETLGKPRQGKLTLKAYNKEHNVVIEVVDDGRGMSPEKLRNKAIEKRLITPETAATLDEQASLELIFLPGFSTADKVTDISGRGVGMDVVRSNIQHLHGSTKLESRQGLGSKITITLPASLMVSKGILIEAGKEEYVFPIESVAQILRLPRCFLHQHDKAHFATYRNEVFSVLRLADHFSVTPPAGEVQWPEEVPLALVLTNRGKVGVAVTRFVGDVEVIVKPMSRDFEHITAFQGTAIMGDGRIALVINPNGFI